MTHFLDLLRGGAGRKTVLLIFQSTHFIYIYYDQYKKYGEKKIPALRFHGNGGHL